jgi:hypothetical protein
VLVSTRIIAVSGPWTPGILSTGAPFQRCAAPTLALTPIASGLLAGALLLAGAVGVALRARAADSFGICAPRECGIHRSHPSRHGEIHALLGPTFLFWPAGYWMQKSPGGAQIPCSGLQHSVPGPHVEGPQGVPALQAPT